MKYFIVAFLLASFIICYEDPDSLQKREEYYSKVGEFTHNAIKLGKSTSKGLGCLANKSIYKDQVLFKVKREFSICSFDLFPFKHEISEILNKYPGFANTPANSSTKYSELMLTYFLLYLMQADREAVEDYIKNQQLVNYYKTFKPNEQIFNSFPRKVYNSPNYTTKEFFILQSLSYLNEEIQDINKIHQHVVSEVSYHDHAEGFYAWTSSWEDLQIAYSLVLSRSKLVSLDTFLKLNGTKVVQMTEADKKNYQLNSFFGKLGGNCIVSYLDLCNHHQPKYLDQRDNVFTEIEAENGEFIVKAKKNYSPGQEVLFTYAHLPGNFKLATNFGFNVRRNIFNQVPLQIGDKNVFSQRQTDLCKELRCFPTDNNYENTGKLNQRSFAIHPGKLDNNFLNYARVSFLNERHDSKEFYKTLANGKIVSYNNEMQSLILYLNALDSKMQECYKRIERAVKIVQNARNKLRSVLRQWKKAKNEKDLVNKNFEKILHEFEISNVVVYPLHRIMASNQAIKQANSEVAKLRTKYIS